MGENEMISWDSIPWSLLPAEEVEILSILYELLNKSAKDLILEELAVLYIASSFVTAANVPYLGAAVEFGSWSTMKHMTEAISRLKDKRDNVVYEAGDKQK